SISLLLLRHPRSPFFPYTTLFRSMALAFGLLFTALYVAGFLLSMRRDGVPLTVSNILRYDGATVSRLIADLKTDGLRAVRHASTDRKSTRLNSSHVAISYAVFCLK